MNRTQQPRQFSLEPYSTSSSIKADFKFATKAPPPFFAQIPIVKKPIFKVLHANQLDKMTIFADEKQQKQIMRVC